MMNFSQLVTMATGLQRGSEDFNIILQRFQTKVYKSHSYNSETIRKSNPDWERKYEPRPFAESIRNILAVLALTPPTQVLTTDPFPKASSAGIGLDTMDIDGGVVPPGTADVPSGVEMLEGERLLCTPKHVVAWTDSTRIKTVASRFTLLLPPRPCKKALFNSS